MTLSDLESSSNYRTPPMTSVSKNASRIAIQNYLQRSSELLLLQRSNKSRHTCQSHLW